MMKNRLVLLGFDTPFYCLLCFAGRKLYYTLPFYLWHAENKAGTTMLVYRFIFSNKVGEAVDYMRKYSLVLFLMYTL